MTNPLDRATPAATSKRGFENMAVGETRTVLMPTAWDEKGKADPASMVPYTMTRTNREFIYDWVDSVSNPSLDRKGKRDIRWVVDDAGNAQILPTKEAIRRAKVRA